MNEKIESRLTVREIQESDYEVLETFLFEAIHVPPGKEPYPWETIYIPEIYVYIKDFGKPDDFGMVAELKGEIIGFAGARLLAKGEIKGFGYVDEQTPELIISVLSQFRGYGVGKRMLDVLHDVLKTNGYENISLSVEKNKSGNSFV